MMAAGVASYQYAVLAISLPVLKKLNMSRKVALAAMSAGAGSVAYGTLIGMPNALNIAPTPTWHHHHGRSRHQPGVYRLFRGVHRGLPDSPEQALKARGEAL